ncbi:sulfotransferase family protein [Lyngbya confervoides]|uniref:Sulfotransferase n=1 Tax=Lyngbya confervoides BDU141951 TaxID=1574623 RepID=A0ABD4SZ17_9CYAN|nr:sulfotransferase [Lyngbya confervoides]MCM1981524.1 sulfotransferase [Lyngbya confervoides BDU141951]
MQPNFLVTGAAKSGTTWLHLCLSEHPQVFLPDAKELHFFSYDSLYAKGVGWYESFFPRHLTQAAIGEISTSYLPSVSAAERIKAYKPEMRLICILRNPIERAYSHYCMDLRAGRATKDMEVGLGSQSPYVQWGLYHGQLTRYRDQFPPQQLKVLLFDDIQHRPADLLREIYDFLEIDPTFTASLLQTPKNAKRSLPKYPRLYRSALSVYETLTRLPMVQGPLESLRLNGAFDFIHRLNQGEQFPALPRDRSRFLVDHYQSDLECLSHSLGKDLMGWLTPYAD